MLSTINAAEILFRHESESRARDHALLRSIRDRRHAETVATAEPRRAAARSPRLTWPRPIGVERCETATCAVA